MNTILKLEIDGKKITSTEYVDLFQKKIFDVLPLNEYLHQTLGGVVHGEPERISQAVEMLDRIEDFNLNEESKILDLGASIPFITWYLSLKHGSTIYCKDRNIKKNYKYEKINGESYDIYRKELGTEEWDFICMTEVLEHLACNLFKVRDQVINSLKANRFMLVSYPLGEPKDYSEDINIDWEQAHGHLREFSIKSAIEFIPNLEIKDINCTGPTGQLTFRPRGSVQILYFKR